MYAFGRVETNAKDKYPEPKLQTVVHVTLTVPRTK